MTPIFYHAEGRPGRVRIAGTFMGAYFWKLPVMQDALSEVAQPLNIWSGRCQSRHLGCSDVGGKRITTQLISLVAP